MDGLPAAWRVRGRIFGAAVAVAAGVLLTACSPQASDVGGSAPAAGYGAATTSAEPAPTPTAALTSAGALEPEPPATATMVCGDEIKDTVAQLDGAAVPPQTTVSWHDGLYTCTYLLPDGVLILSVKQSVDGDAALTYFTALKSATADTTALEGLNGLGLPAYRSAGGTVAFVKDELTLLVDATGMPATVGPQRTERTSYAFTVASNVLACWKGQ